jgi:hypothetical protein
MSEAAVPGATQMSPQARKRFFIGLTALVILLFVGGAAAWALDFSHQQVCPGGKHWIAQGNDSMGAVTYLCPNGLTVTQGVAP